MSEVILLSDTLSHGEIGNSRYMAPYVIASQLENAGFDARVIDYFTRIDDFFNYIESFLTEKILMIGISTTFLMPPASKAHVGRESSFCKFLWLSSEDELQRWFAQLRALLNKFNPNAKIVLGGTKAVNADFDKNVYGIVDFINIGAADLSLIDFVTALKKGARPEFIITERGTNILDNRTQAAKKHCPETNYLRKYAIQPNESLPIEISRGCVFNCRFCSFDRTSSARKDEQTLSAEFRRNYENYGTTVYHFCDDCFNDARSKVESVCNVILKLPFKIEWISYARVDLSIRAPETLEMMIESGAKGLYFGVESLNSVVAKNAGKGVPSEMVKEFLIDFRRKYSDRCLLQASLIAGLPGETTESFLDTGKWMLENASIDFLCLGPLTLAPYVEKLDKLMVDYSEYIRRPEAFGFTKVSFEPYYWEHATMNSDQAKYLAQQLFTQWRKKNNTFLRSIWLYPLMRSLGYSWEDIVLMSRDPSVTSRWYSEVPTKFRNYINKYHADLQSLNRQSKSSNGILHTV